MATVIQPSALEYLKDAEFEVPAIAMIDGVAFRAKADILKGTQLIDLKTTTDLKKFQVVSLQIRLRPASVSLPSNVSRSRILYLFVH